MACLLDRQGFEAMFACSSSVCLLSKVCFACKCKYKCEQALFRPHGLIDTSPVQFCCRTQQCPPKQRGVGGNWTVLFLSIVYPSLPSPRSSKILLITYGYSFVFSFFAFSSGYFFLFLFLRTMGHTSSWLVRCCT